MVVVLTIEAVLLYELTVMLLQTLLAERFQLKFHRETKEMPAYALVVGNKRASLKPSAPDVESKTVRAGRLRTNYTNVRYPNWCFRSAHNSTARCSTKRASREVTILRWNICRASSVRSACCLSTRPSWPSAILPTKHNRFW